MNPRDDDGATAGLVPAPPAPAPPATVRRPRLLAWAAGLLVLAVLSVIGVAWTATWRSWPEGMGRFTSQPIDCEDGILRRHYPASLTGAFCQQYQARGFGWEALLADSQSQPVAVDGFVTMGVRRSGWPLPALAGEWRSEGGGREFRSAWRWIDAPVPRHMWAFLPLRPLWPGLLANVAASWAALVVLALAIRGLWLVLTRRRRRLRCGLCPHCGYAFHGSGAAPGRCAECGRSLPATRGATAARPPRA